MAVAQPEVPAKLAFRIEGHTFASQEEFLEWHRKTADAAQRIAETCGIPAAPTHEAPPDVKPVTPVVEKVQIIRVEDCKTRSKKTADMDSVMLGVGILAGLGAILTGGYLIYRLGQRGRNSTPDGYPRPHDESWYTGELGPMDMALTGGDVIVL